MSCSLESFQVVFNNLLVKLPNAWVVEDNRKARTGVKEDPDTVYSKLP